MVTLRDLHRYQTARSMVQLEDGRVGKIVRVDTTFPGNCTEVSVYTVEVGRSAPTASVEDDEPVTGTEKQTSAAASRGTAPSRAATGGASASAAAGRGTSEQGTSTGERVVDGDTGRFTDADEDSSGRRLVSGPGIARVSLDRIVGLAKVSG